MMPCAPRMAGCKASCLHRALVNDYRVNRHAEEQAADAASIGYATERAEYVERHPLTTFKQWLIGHRRHHQEVAA